MYKGLVSVFVLGVHLILLSTCEEGPEQDEGGNVVEFSYLDAAASNVEGVTEDIPVTTTTEILPMHPQLKESDKHSVPIASGMDIQLGNLTVYQSPFNNASKAMLISIYDIFGLHPHVKYISDQLAESGFLAVIPDFFHGNPINLETFPQQSDYQRLGYLFATNGSWVDVKKDLQEVIAFYKNKYAINAVGLYGFCWGGKMAVYAASDSRLVNDSSIKAIGLVHPSKVTTQEAADIKVPAVLLPSGDEPDMIPFLDGLDVNLRNQSEHFRFSGMKHGFAGARSDFSDSNIRKDVSEAIKKLASFFARELQL